MPAISVNATEPRSLLRAVRELFTLTPPAVEERFDELIARMQRRTLSAQYAAELLESILRQHLSHTRAHLHESMYRPYLQRIVKALQESLKDILQIAKENLVYVQDLKEVWLACEPMLDLVDGPSGWQETLVTLLRRGIRFYYVINEERYFHELRRLLAERGLTEEQIDLTTLVRVEKAYVPPIALWIGDKSCAGAMGLNRPRIERKPSGHYSLCHPLREDWLSFMSTADARDHYNQLSAVYLGGGTR